MHFSPAALKHAMSENLVSGMSLDSLARLDSVCIPCLARKMHANPFPSTGNSTPDILGLIHMDLVGPMPVCTHSGFRYFVGFHDDASKFRAAYPLRSKDEALDAFVEFKAWAENQTGKRIKAIQDDKGGKFIGHRWDNFCSKHGIQQRHMTKNHPQQNGVAECGNCTILEGISSALAESGLPCSFWGECLAAFLHVWNCLPASTSNTCSTPYQAWFGTVPDISHLRVWGCRAFVHIQRDKRAKLDPHMLPAVFIGYPDGYKGWKFWDPVSKRTIISERAEFDEFSFPLSKQPLTAPSTEPSSSYSLPLPLEAGGDVSPAAPVVPVAVPAPAELPATPAPSVSLQMPSIPSPLPIAPPAVPLARPDSPPSPSPAPVLRRSSRATKAHPPDGWQIPASAHLRPIADDPKELSSPINADQTRYESPEPWDEDPTEVLAAELTIDAFSTSVPGGAQNEPKTFREALTCPDADLWTQAALEELEAHQQNKTWPRTQLPKGASAIGCHWVFKVKRNADGSIERYKARLVAKGFSQRPGFDFTETFAPTAKYQAIRTVFALAAVEDLHL